MATLRLTKGGRIELPAELLASHRWQIGIEFTLEDRPEGLLLRPLTAQPKSRKTVATGHGEGGGRDRALADAMRDRYARLGH